MNNREKLEIAKEILQLVENHISGRSALQRHSDRIPEEVLLEISREITAFNKAVEDLVIRAADIHPWIWRRAMDEVT